MRIRSVQRKLLSALLVALLTATFAQPQQKTEKSLYQRIGGYDVIAAVVDDLFVQLRADPNFARFATGRSRDSHMRARQLIVDQLCARSGGPCVYIGRDMKTVHTGLGIAESEWQANMKYTALACDKNKVAPKEKEELLALMSRFRDVIVEKP